MAKSLPYRPNVGIMVLSREGKVWIGRRANTSAWQMPQGGIDEGEDPQAASLRELYEETGMISVRLLQETDGWLRYDFPTGMKRKIADKYSGQKQKWFAYRFEGLDEEIQINPPPDGHKAEFDDWRWADMASLPELIVDFKRDVYQKVVDNFRHLGS